MCCSGELQHLSVGGSDRPAQLVRQGGLVQVVELPELHARLPVELGETYSTVTAVASARCDAECAFEHAYYCVTGTP